MIYATTVGIAAFGTCRRAVAEVGHVHVLSCDIHLPPYGQA